jgi:hypothetical protein
MAQKRSAGQAGPVRNPGQSACQCGRVTVESIAADLFVRAYPTKGGYRTEHIASEAINAAEEFMKQLSHR